MKTILPIQQILCSIITKNCIIVYKIIISTFKITLFCRVKKLRKSNQNKIEKIYYLISSFFFFFHLNFKNSKEEISIIVIFL